MVRNIPSHRFPPQPKTTPEQDVATRKKSTEKEGKERNDAEAKADLQKKKATVRRIGAILRKQFPRTSRYEREVSFVDTLVAIILSQNTSDVNSHRAYVTMRAAYPTWEEVAAADPAELAAVIRVGGLADQKSRAILNTLDTFLERWGDFTLTGIEDIPDDELLAILTAVPGVGLKSASCAMMFALERDLCAVDTHLHRILNRLGIVHTSGPDKTFHALRPLIPKGEALRLHVSLIRFGREICKARLPHCFECPLYDLCEWEEKEAHAAARRQGPKAVSGDFLITDGI